MEGNGTATAHLFYAALLRVKVVLPRSTGNYLAFLGDTEALGIRLVRFHITTALLRGGDSMPEIRQNANPMPQLLGQRERLLWQVSVSEAS